MKRILQFILLVLVATLCFSMISCRKSDSNDKSGGDDNANNETVDVSGITFVDTSFVYDGSEKVIEINGNLPEGVTVQYVNNKKVDAGTYTAIARLYDKNDKQIKELTAKLTINKAKYDMSGITMPDVTHTYNGASHSPSIVGELPDGVTVTYVASGSIKNAGVYTVRAIFTGNSNYEDIPSITATYTVTKATYDMSGVSFADAEFAYTGKEVAPQIIGILPDGVSVKFVSNPGTIKGVGEYAVTAIFTGDVLNYNLISNMTATYTVVKGNYDMSGISFADAEFSYTGREVKPQIVGKLPEGVTVSFVSDPAVIKEMGEYTVTAIFSGDLVNYNSIPNMVAKYTILEMNSDDLGVSMPDRTVSYTGEVIEPILLGTLPEGITAEITSDPAIIRDVGVYTVTVKFYLNGEYGIADDMIATYTVTKGNYDMSGVSFIDAEFAYTGREVMPQILGKLPDGVSVEFVSTPGVIKNVGKYTVTAIFTVTSENYNAIPNMTATYTIKKGTYDMSGVSLPSVTVNYSGKEVVPYLAGTLPEGVTYSITSTPAPIVEAGTYIVTVSFIGSDQYEPIPDMTTTYVIRMPQYIEGSLNFEALSDGTYEVVGYNGTVTELLIPDKHLGKAVTSIRSSAFMGNKDLTYVVIPDSVTNVGNKAFKNCENLSTVIVSKNIKVIGAEAFANTALTEIVLPDSLQSLGQSSFEGTMMQAMTLPFVGGSRITSNPFIGYLFGALTYAGNAAKVPETLTTITISGSNVPAYSFYGVESLVSVVIKSGATSIGNSAFSGCTSLADVYIAATVTKIEANANVFNSPFYNTSDMLMLVLGSNYSEGFGKYWNVISEGEEALVVYGKSYEDYLMNKDEYRNLDTAAATLDGIFIDGTLIDSFAADIFNYAVSVDINKGYPIVTATRTSWVSRVEIVNPTAANSGVATIEVTSADGLTVNTYTVTVNLTGTFTGTSAEVVGKDGTTGTVTFVIDDGDKTTANFTTEMMDKYSELKFTYAILTNQLATLNTAYDSSTGKYYYVMSDGEYTYTVKQDTVDFWNNILANYDTEVVSHTYSHLFWGNNDEGGVQKYVDSNGNVITSGNLPVGSASAEIYASIQIIEDLLGIKAATHVVPGIGVATTDKVVNGVTYATYYTYYQELLKEAIESGAILALAGNTMGNVASSMDRYVTKDNITTLGVNGVARLFVRPDDNKDTWKQFIANAAANNGWATFCIHKISESATSGHYILEKDAEELFAYAVSENIWIANYTEAFLYYTQWASAKVNVVYENDSIKVTLTDDEDNTVYNEALTVKVTIPANWAAVEVNGDTLEVYADQDGSSYVLVDIVPDSGTVTLNAKI